MSFKSSPSMLSSRPANAPTPVAVRAVRALIVDDDKFMLTVLTDHLHGLGLKQVSTATNGMDAANALDRMQPAPELVVCDLKMPGGDGFQFMEMLAARGFAGGVVLVSGLDARVMNSAALMARFHRLRILATLTKPVDAQALGAALAKLA